MDMEERFWDKIDDPDQFARIWKRVVPEEREYSPIQPLKTEGVPEKRGQAEAPPPCLGKGHPMASFLRRQIMNELSDWQVYLTLAQHRNGALRSIAMQELFHARRLSAAYFLITGIRYLPIEQTRARSGSHRMDLQAELRGRVQAEEQGEATYRQAAEQAGADAILKTLFLELAAEEGKHAARIRQMLERWHSYPPCNWDII